MTGRRHHPHDGGDEDAGRDTANDVFPRRKARYVMGDEAQFCRKWRVNDTGQRHERSRQGGAHDSSDNALFKMAIQRNENETKMPAASPEKMSAFVGRSNSSMPSRRMISKIRCGDRRSCSSTTTRSRQDKSTALISWATTASFFSFNNVFKLSVISVPSFAWPTWYSKTQ